MIPESPLRYQQHEFREELYTKGEAGAVLSPWQHIQMTKKQTKIRMTWREVKMWALRTKKSEEKWDCFHTAEATF